MVKYAILGYNTINIGDDIQSFITSTLLKIDYIIMRDDYDKIYEFNTGKLVNILNDTVYIIMNGWFMHNSNWKTGNDNIKFPIKNDRIIPIYISCCLSKDVPLLYNKECINNYKEHAPILCRDTTTLYNLQKYNVDVIYYGCVTQLLDILNIPDNETYKDKYSDSNIYIDCYELYTKRDTTKKSFFFKHYISDLMNMNVKERINYAVDLLSKYKYAKKIYSGRLHAFLPCRAMGLDIEYVGDLNYRVKDLVLKIPNKTKLKEQFYDYVYNKSKC